MGKRELRTILGGDELTTLTGCKDFGNKELDTGTVGSDITEGDEGNDIPCDEEEGNLRLVTVLLLSLMTLLLLSIMLFLVDDVASEDGWPLLCLM